jgi:PKD repeat protein
MKTSVIFSIVFLLLVSPARADDHIIVVDSSYAMRVYFPLKKDGKLRARKVKRVKWPFVQKQLEQYLTQIPNDGSRVYVVYYHEGIATLNGKLLATEFVFGENGEGKRKAIEQVSRYPQIIPKHAAGVLVGLLQNRRWPNHLWSTFHVAMKHAEVEKYYQPPIGQQPEIFPHILLITDEPDDQQGKETWDLSQAIEKRDFHIGHPHGKREPAHPDHVIMQKHPWLLRHTTKVWYQISKPDPVSKQWKGKIVRVLPHGKLASLPFINPPVIELGGINPPDIGLGGKKPGAQISQAKVNQLIQLKAHGDQRLEHYHWSWKVGDGKFTIPVPGRSQEEKFEKAGFYTIRLEAIPRNGGAALTTEKVVQVGGNVIVANNPPDKPDPIPPPPPPKPLDIAAAFTLQTIVKDNQPRPIINAEVLWAFDPEGIQVSFKNETVAKIEGQVENAELTYDWALGGAKPAKDNRKQPNPMKFKPGQYTIGLAATQKGKIKNTDQAEELTFEVQLVQVKLGVKDFNGKIFRTKPGQQVEFQLKENAAPKDTTYAWDFGDGTPLLKGKKAGDLKYTYQEFSTKDDPFQPKVTATLPSGQFKVLKFDIAIEVSKDLIVAKAFPDPAWPGEQVTLKLPGIVLKEIEKVTWTVNGKEIPAKREQKFELSYAFKKPGPQPVTFEVKKNNVNKPIPGKLDVNVREVKPEIICKDKEVLIGQPIRLTVVNAPGEPPFPKNYKIKFTGVGLNAENHEKVFFAEPGEKEIKASVIVILEGIEVPFESETSVKIKVNGFAKRKPVRKPKK